MAERTHSREKPRQTLLHRQKEGSLFGWNWLCFALQQMFTAVSSPCGKTSTSSRKVVLLRLEEMELPSPPWTPCI